MSTHTTLTAIATANGWTVTGTSAQRYRRTIGGYTETVVIGLTTTGAISAARLERDETTVDSASPRTRGKADVIRAWLESTETADRVELFDAAVILRKPDVSVQDVRTRVDAMVRSALPAMLEMVRERLAQRAASEAVIAAPVETSSVGGVVHSAAVGGITMDVDSGEFSRADDAPSPSVQTDAYREALEAAPVILETPSAPAPAASLEAVSDPLGRASRRWTRLVDALTAAARAAGWTPTPAPLGMMVWTVDAPGGALRARVDLTPTGLVRRAVLTRYDDTDRTRWSTLEDTGRDGSAERRAVTAMGWLDAGADLAYMAAEIPLETVRALREAADLHGWTWTADLPGHAVISRGALSVDVHLRRGGVAMASLTDTSAGVRAARANVMHMDGDAAHRLTTVGRWLETVGEAVPATPAARESSTRAPWLDANAPAALAFALWAMRTDAARDVHALGDDNEALDDLAAAWINSTPRPADDFNDVVEYVSHCGFDGLGVGHGSYTHPTGVREVFDVETYAAQGNSDDVTARERARGVALCGACGRRWDDSVSTAVTPTPGGRCPWESEHTDDAESLAMADNSDDDACACGASLDDGEGWDGRCGTCADALEDDTENTWKEDHRAEIMDAAAGVSDDDHSEADAARYAATGHGLLCGASDSDGDDGVCGEDGAQYVGDVVRCERHAPCGEVWCAHAGEDHNGAGCVIPLCDCARYRSAPARCATDGCDLYGPHDASHEREAARVAAVEAAQSKADAARTGDALAMLEAALVIRYGWTPDVAARAAREDDAIDPWRALVQLEAATATDARWTQRARRAVHARYDAARTGR